MSIDIMIDLETTGTRAGCAILSIGACSIDEKDQFYASIKLDTATVHGLKTEAGTMAWWGRQSEEARKEAFSGQESLIEALGRFSDWLRGVEKRRGEAFVWGNGADFDLPILSACYEAVDMGVPWKPFNGRCYRTLKNLYKDIKMDEFVGTKHNALADAINQSSHMLKILQSRKQMDMFTAGY